MKSNEEEAPAMTPQTLTATATGYEELASRESNGIRVSLLWSRRDGDVKVTVYNPSTDSAFELPVGDAAPLDVFHHPFAHAAFRGVAYDAAPLELHPDPVAA